MVPAGYNIGGRWPYKTGVTLPAPSTQARLGRALLHPRFPWVLALVAFVVHVPGLGAGYLVDDHTHRWFARGMTIPGGPRGLWDLYRFADGGEGVRRAVDSGLHPWWTAPGLKLSFFRPVASLLRVSEEALFGNVPLLCHLVSTLLFVATALAVLRLFRLWIGGAAASLGALLFVLDDAHASTVTWIAARHSLLATLFVVLALEAHLRARGEGRVSLASGALFFTGLASSESALSGLAYFAAIALFYDARPARERARALAPAAAATLVWAGCYVALDHGSAASAYYVDPLHSPLRFARAAALRAPTLALAQLFGPPSEVASMAPSAGVALAALGALFLATFSWLTLRRLPDRPRVLSLLVAFVLALAPACGTNSDDRLLLLPGIAAFGLLASWGRRAAGPAPSLPLRLAAAVGVFVHIVLAVLLLPARTLTMASMLSGIVDRGSASLPGDPAIFTQELVVLSSPDGLLPSSMLVKRMVAGGPAPRTGRILTTSPATPATLSRVAPSVLEIRSDGGMMRDPFIGAVRPRLFDAGERVELRGLTILVLSVRDGYPTAIRFSFAEGSLDDGTRRFATWKDHGFAEVSLPAVGGALTLPTLDFAEELSWTK